MSLAAKEERRSYRTATRLGDMRNRGHPRGSECERERQEERARARGTRSILGAITHNMGSRVRLYVHARRSSMELSMERAEYGV